MVTAGWGSMQLRKGKLIQMKRGALVMSLEEEVLTLMATAGDQADFIAGGAACRRTARRRCRWTTRGQCRRTAGEQEPLQEEEV